MPSTLTFRAMALGVLLCSMGCTGPFIRDTQSPDGVSINWLTTIHGDHPLVGRLWSVGDKAFIGPDEMRAALAKSRFVLLGERHDQPDHHQLQAWIVSGIKTHEVIGFEMLDEGDAPNLGASHPDALRDAVAWGKSGWPDFELYRPIFAVAHDDRRKVVALHPSRVRLRALMRGPSSQSTENKRLPATIQKDALGRLKADIRESHCGHARGPMVHAMVLAQLFKDRWMSQQLIAQSTGRKGIVIAGNGHVRKDYGMPNHLKDQSVSVGLLEVESGKDQVHEYGPDRYDYIWFTPRLDTVDPCEKYRKILERMRRKKTGIKKKPPNISAGGQRKAGQ